MAGRLAGKTAFLTAAAHGIGRATALAFAREGARVIATDIDDAGLASLARECGCTTRRLDVLDAAAIEAAAREVGTVQVLFNAAGVVHAGNVLEASEADWELAFDLNARAMARTIRAFLPGMLAAGGGAIVNVASVASSVKGVPNRFVYGASKAAVIGLTKAVAADFVTRGIRCNAICPGTVESRRLRRPPADGAPGPRRRDRRAGGAPGQRRGRLHHRQRDDRRRRHVELSPPPKNPATRSTR